MLDEAADENLFTFVQNLKPYGKIKLSIRKRPDQIPRLDWVLLTSLEVNSFEDACRVVEWYRCRWIIEEYHKAIKSGCKVEKRQLKTVERLENFLGIADIVAISLLRLRDVARNTPTILAKDLIDPLKVDILIQYRGLKKNDITIYEYYREVAKIGGFIGRKSDNQDGKHFGMGKKKLHSCILVQKWH